MPDAVTLILVNAAVIAVTVFVITLVFRHRERRRDRDLARIASAAAEVEHRRIFREYPYKRAPSQGPPSRRLVLGGL